MELLLYGWGIDDKSLAAGIVVGLITGFTAGCAATSTVIDLERLKRRICQLEEKVDLLGSQIHGKDKRIANLQSQVEELQPFVPTCREKY